MQFNKLRLTGFKSFVDGTDLDIAPGLTGIVGPNGCGKSNLVEALRWVMGETSAKQMRGSEMDDVIFAGSRNRPARNIAEVGLALDNSERGAPAQFNDNDDLEVTRKIEREKGSTYRVNAKEVRARDVHRAFDRMIDINRRYSSIEISANLVLGPHLPDTHFPSCVGLLEKKLSGFYSKGTLYMSPLLSPGSGNGPARKKMLDQFFTIKRLRKLETLLYLIQRL
mgnify:CR=1 FL=1